MNSDKSTKFIDILGYKVFSSTKEKCLDEVFNYDKVHIISGNPEVLFTGLNNEELLKNFRSDRAIIIPDGIGVLIAAKILKTEVKEKIAGIDFMKDIIKKCEKDGKTVFLLGASEESLNSCVVKLLTQYPNLDLVGYKNGFFNIDDNEKILNEIKKKKPDVLFVAMGCPRQERFIVKYMDELPVKILMGVGGSFDVIGNKVKRAPKWIIKIGMEWAYRVLREPSRIMRLGSIPKFLFLVLKSRHNKN